MITAVAAAEKEAIQITWVKETLKRMMGGDLVKKIVSRSPVDTGRSGEPKSRQTNLKHD